MKIAVLEQDRPQADLICQVLSAAGHSCQSYDSAKELLGQLRKDSADMLVEAVKAAGVSDAQIVDLTLAITAITLTNLFNRINDTVVDFPKVA